MTLATVFIVMVFLFAMIFVIVAGAHIAGRARGRQQLIELAQRERLALLERGVDPHDLPPLPALTSADGGPLLLSPRESCLRRAQDLLVTGMIVLGIGLPGVLFFYAVAPGSHLWTLGLVLVGLGVALLISAQIVRRSCLEEGTSKKE